MRLMLTLQRADVLSRAYATSCPEAAGIASWPPDPVKGQGQGRWKDLSILYTVETEKKSSYSAETLPSHP